MKESNDKMKQSYKMKESNDNKMKKSMISWKKSSNYKWTLLKHFFVNILCSIDVTPLHSLNI